MLYRNNIPVPVEETFSVRIITVNPACFHDKIPGNAGLGIDIPVNEHSRAIFGNPERFEKYGSGSDRKFPGFEIRLKGVLLECGTLVITNASQNRYAGWLQSELGELGEEQREKYIDEMQWPGDQTFINKSVYSSSVDDYTSPLIRNTAFWEEKGKQIPEKIKYKDEDGVWQEKEEMIGKLTKLHRDNFGYRINQRASGIIKTWGEGCVVSPMLFLDYTLKEMFKMNRWYVDRNDLYQNWTMRQLFIYNNFNILKPTFSVEMRPFVWEWDHETQDYIETNWLTIYNTTWAVDLFNFRDLLPHVSLKDFILGVQNHLNYIFFFRSDRKIDIIDRNAIPEGTPIDLDRFFVDEWEIGDRQNLKLKFVSEYDRNDGIQGDSWHDLSDRWEDFGSPVETSAELEALADPRIGELRLVIEENKIYEWKWAVHTSVDALYYEHQEDVLRWEFVSSGPQHFLYGDADEMEEIKTCFSTLLKVFKAFGIDILAIPYVQQRGNIDTMRSLWSDYSPRLLLNSDITGAASDQMGGYNLNWDGPNGLFEKRWKKWARIWKNRLPVEARFDLPLNVIDYVKANIHRKFRTRHGEFIIEEMETEFGLDQIGITRIKGYKI